VSSVVLVTRDPQQAIQWRDQLTAAQQHQVVAITNAARSARALLAQHRPRVVVCDLRLLDGTALAMIQSLASEADAQRPVIIVVATDGADPLLREAMRSGADNYHVPGPQCDTLSVCVRKTLLGESALTRSIALALLDHFDRATQRRGDWTPIDEVQSPLQLAPQERELLLRVASGRDLQQLAEQHALNPHVLGVAVRAIYRKIQWDQRAGSLSLQLA
jgi:DNA-binding NarL/FixJ family response regulator